MFRRIWLERRPVLGLPGPFSAGVWFCSLPSVYLLSHCPSKQVFWPRTSSEQKELMILFLCMASSTGHLGQVYQNVCLVFMWCLYSFYFFLSWHLFIWDKNPCYSSGLSEAHCLSQANLKFVFFLLPQLPECLHFRYLSLWSFVQGPV